MASSAQPAQTVFPHDHPYGRPVAFVILTITIIAVITTLSRLCTRLSRRKFGLDDLAILIATAVAIFGDVCLIIATGKGVGSHVYDIKSHARTLQAIEWILISAIQSYIGLFFLRLSIGIFILRMLVENTTHRRVKYTVYACLFLNFATTAAAVVSAGIQCRPLQAAWDPNIHGQCLSQNLASLIVTIFAAISAATDALYGMLPIAIFWPLKMPWKTKINFMIVMLLIFIICACAIAKAVTVRVSSSDFTWVEGIPLVWASFEVNLGIIVANLPTLQQAYYLIHQNDPLLRFKESVRKLLYRQRGSTQSVTEDDATDIPNREKKNSRPNRTREEPEANKRRIVSIQQEIDVEQSPNDPLASSKPTGGTSGIWCGNPEGMTYSVQVESLSARESRHYV